MTVQTQETGKAVSSVIAQSWHRCSKFMQRETWQTPHQARGLTFDSICRRKTALLTIGQAALEDAGSLWTVAPARCLFLMSLPASSAVAASRKPRPSWLPGISRRQLLCGEHYRHLRAVAGRDAGPADQHRRRSAF